MMLLCHPFQAVRLATMRTELKQQNDLLGPPLELSLPELTLLHRKRAVPTLSADVRTTWSVPVLSHALATLQIASSLTVHVPCCRFVNI